MPTISRNWEPRKSGIPNNTYLAHGAGVYRDLKSWGCSQELCDAGMFHSIYGTELFQDFTLPLERRGEVRNLIGERAERLVYLNCCLLRAISGRERRAGTGALHSQGSIPAAGDRALQRGL